MYLKCFYDKDKLLISGWSLTWDVFKVSYGIDVTVCLAGWSLTWDVFKEVNVPRHAYTDTVEV